MLLHKARQSVHEVFQTARQLPTVKGRVDQATFFAAVSVGVRAGRFGYAESADGAIQRGAGASLTPEEVAFTGWLIGEDTPLPLTAEELARLLPASGRLAVEELYAQAVQTYGAERVTEQGVLDLLQRILREGRCGYAESADAPVRPGPAAVALAGYVGQPELPPPDTRIIRLRGIITPVEMANVMKTAMNLSRLSAESSITLALDLELKGEVNDHSVQMALREIQGRVAGVEVEDVKGE